MLNERNFHPFVVRSFTGKSANPQILQKPPREAESEGQRKTPRHMSSITWMILIPRATWRTTLNYSYPQSTCRGLMRKIRRWSLHHHHLWNMLSDYDIKIFVIEISKDSSQLLFNNEISKSTGHEPLPPQFKNVRVTGKGRYIGLLTTCRGRTQFSSRLPSFCETLISQQFTHSTH